jgi:tripartite-type tricarboxylate transporter receptor subunit TctC
MTLRSTLRLFSTAILAISAAAFGLPAWAAYPDQVIRFVIPFGAGGPADIIGRLFADKLSHELGQSVVVDNRPGAGGSIGADYVTHLAPDGYTLMLASPAILSVNPFLYKSVTYDPITGFTPISLIANAPNVLVVLPTQPFKTLPELVAYARQHPGKLTFGSSGSGTSNHLGGEALKLQAGVDMLHVPYKSQAAAMQDLLGGRIDMIFDTLPTSIGPIRTGQLRPLALAAPERSSLLPDVPTTAEAGAPGVIAGSWYAVMGPPGMPAAIVDRVNRALTDICADEAFANKLRDLGTPCLKSSPAELRDFIQAQFTYWGDVIRKAKITAE